MVSITLLLLIISGFAQIGALTSGPGLSSKTPASIQQQGTGTPLALNVTLSGAGATFPAPLIAVWQTQYHLQRPNVTITYAPVGSGTGQGRYANKTVDFGATDAPLSVAQRPLYPNVLHIPETIGSVTASYNLPGISSGLNFTGAVLANIFLDNIVSWNDPAIQSLNPGVTLPPNVIQVVHRQESSGTTFVWTSFLCLDSITWCSTVGRGTTVNWPTGVGATGNGGVAAYIKNNPYTLGYVELSYVLNPTSAITYGNVQNPAGNFIQPTVDSTNFAVGNSTQSLPSGAGDWSGVSLLNAAGSKTYPIASFTYFLVYKELNVIPDMNNNEGAQAKEFIRFLTWVITTGQTFSRDNNYVPLPSGVVAIDQASINSLTYTINSTPVTKTISLSGSASGGWSSTTISVTSGDTVTLNLASTDTLAHQWYIDYNNNGAVDANETWLESSAFSSSTPTPFTFTPTIWSQTSVPKAGSFTFRCAFHPTTMTGTIKINQQQVAAVLPQPSNSLTTPSRTVQDNSRLTTVGSVLVDTRTATASGNITLATVDKTSGSLTFAKGYVLPNLGFSQVVGSQTATLRFVLTAAEPTQFTLSSNVLVQYQVSSGLGTLTAGVSSYTRNLDMANKGLVNIIDVGIVYAQYGLTSASPNFNPLADLDGNGVINIIDAGIIALNFDAPAFY